MEFWITIILYAPLFSVILADRLIGNNPTENYWGCYFFDASTYSNVHPNQQMFGNIVDKPYTDGYNCINFCKTVAPGKRNYNFAAISGSQTCYCLEDFPERKNFYDDCTLQCNEDSQRVCSDNNVVQLFGLCPKGQYGAPLCEGPCPQYCSNSQPDVNWTVPMCYSADGKCTFGCLNDVCGTYADSTDVYSFNTVDTSITTSLPVNLPRPLKMGLSLFPKQLTLKNRGYISKIVGIVQNVGWSFLSAWRPSTETIFELVNKIEFKIVSVPENSTIARTFNVTNGLHLEAGDVLGVHHSYETSKLDPSKQSLFTLWSAAYDVKDYVGVDKYLFLDIYDDGWPVGKRIKPFKPADIAAMSLIVEVAVMCPANCKGSCSNIAVCDSGCKLGYMGKTCNKTCPLNYYGMNCSLPCPTQCIAQNCEPVTGRCEKGCMPGFNGPFCDKICVDGMYGSNCAFNCSGNCLKGVICDKTDGSCVTGCTLGYQPPLCREICKPGTFGESCKYKCGHCIGGSGMCRSTDGTCFQGCSDPMYMLPQCLCPKGTFIDDNSLTCSMNCGFCKDGVCSFNGECKQGCMAGYQPPHCKCKLGFYGSDCSRPCPNCLSGCHFLTGVCTDTCIEGYFPFPYCNTTCNDFYFGKGCYYFCGFCAANPMCNKLTGRCPGDKCVHGFSPPRCRCVVGYWGLQCDQTCGHCYNGSFCRDDGLCPENSKGVVLCDDGYKPPNCTCPVGSWGDTCQNSCGHCKAGTDCFDTNGTCPNGCNSYYRPPDCMDLLCPEGYYGTNCDKVCGQCIGGVACEQSTGFCPGPCDVGLQPPFCNTQCIPGFYGYSCMDKCGNCAGNQPCDPKTGYCPSTCMPGYLMPQCLETCANFTYGPNCNKICGFCLGGEPCHPVMGYCRDGCINSRLKLPTCNTCDKGYYGFECQANASQNCKNPGVCNTVSGACDNGCQSNYKPPLCVEVYAPGEQSESTLPQSAANVLASIDDNTCFRGTYGVSGLFCTLICGQCKDGGPCSENGRCAECDTGFKMPYCTECADGFYGLNCQFQCGQCKGKDVCDSYGGICPNGCSDSSLTTTVCKPLNQLNLKVCDVRYFPPDCNSTCPYKMYGSNCAKTCGNCQDLNFCGVMDGACYSGCSTGFTGSTCVEDVNENKLVSKERSLIGIRKRIRLQSVINQGVSLHMKRLNLQLVLTFSVVCNVAVCFSHMI